MASGTLFYGLKGGKPVHISEAANGLKCDCICSYCKNILIAKNKGNKKKPHFAHYKSDDCFYGNETAIHLIAKEIFKKARKFKFPEVIVYADVETWKQDHGYIRHRKIIVNKRERLIPIDEVYIEKSYEGFKPDILIFAKDKPLIVEVRVTHPVDEDKLVKIRNSGTSAIEIDLQGVDPSIYPEELEDLVLINSKNRHWLYNRYGEDEKESFEHKFYKSKEDREKREVWYKRYYKNVVIRETAVGTSIRHVDNCPRKVRCYEGKYYANIDLDCMGCEFSRKTRENGKYLICLHSYYTSK